ncbi:MAG: carboxymuconolactone decarboxylase family protein [Caulobacterales bacterium]
MTRQTLADPKSFTDKQAAEYEAFTKARKPRPDGSLGGPFDPWLTNPELFRRLRGLGAMLWERTSLDRGMVELAISITGWFWQSNVEWSAHAPRAVEYGIPQSVIDDVLAGRRPNGGAEQVLLYDVCIAMHREHALSQALYGRAVAAFTERGLAELMAVIGYYTLVSMTLNAFEVEVAPGVAAPFKR